VTAPSRAVATLGAVDALVAVVGRRIAPAGVVGWPHAGAVAVAAPYLDALKRAGAQEAVLYPEPIDDDAVARRLARFDGLVLIGGPDVDPARYGADRHDKTAGVDPEQDDYELHMARGAIAAGLPLLAICRGLQVLNVALGGTLVQHLPDIEGTGSHTVVGASEAGGRHDHRVRVAAGSRLAIALGATDVVGPSSHHQAIDRVGDGLVPVAWSVDDGVIEGVELDTGWVVGVQWHPESSAERDPQQQALFDAFVARAATTARV